MVHILHWAGQVCNVHVHRAFGCQVAEDPGVLFAGEVCAAPSSLIAYLGEMLQAHSPPQAPGQTLYREHSRTDLWGLLLGPLSKQCDFKKNDLLLRLCV